MRTHPAVWSLALAALVTATAAAPIHAASGPRSKPAGAVVAGKSASSRLALPFIENDYPRALAEARARKVPLFIDAWAPWCHTCRSMRAFVLTDSSLARHAGRFVWLEIDTERKENVPLRKQLGITALPTFYVIDPKDERVALRWLGGFTVAQFEQLLADGEAAVTGRKVAGPADEALAQADRAYGAGDYAAAAKAYTAALAAAGPGWTPYSRAIEALLYSLDQGEDYAAEAEVADEAWPRLKGTPSGANVVSYGLGAALVQPDSTPGRADRVARFEALAREVLADRTLAIAADDRSGLYISLLDARQQANDSLGARAVATEWAAFLETAAAGAKTPEQRAVFDPHRLSAYLELGEPERAVPMLLASERDLPDDYNPSARLAGAYKAMKQWDEALAASDRALAKAYGPRKLGIYSTRLDILIGRGDVAGARAALAEALAYADSLPAGQRSESTLAALRRKLDEAK
jgi:thiol-disulfide isomerase/thioredoxin